MWEEIFFTLPAPGRVDAHFGDFTVASDHPPAGRRAGRAPEPFALFLASIGSCAASFVAEYCRQHDLPLDGVRLVQRQAFAEPDHTIPEFAIDIVVPPGFPAAHREGLIAAASDCTVKRVMEAAPAFRFTVRVDG